MGAPNLDPQNKSKDFVNNVMTKTDWKKKCAAAGGGAGVLMMSTGMGDKFAALFTSLHLDGLVKMIPGGTAFLPVIVLGAIGTGVGMYLDSYFKGSK